MAKKPINDGKPKTRLDQTKAYRNLTLNCLYKLTEEEAWSMVRRCRWGAGEETQCPDCGHCAVHYFIKTRRQWTCKECMHRFSVTSGTPLSSRKLPLRDILIKLFHFISEPQGQSANALHSKIGLSLKTVWLGIGKFREALFETQDLQKLEGVVHIDAGYFCGKRRNQAMKHKADSNSVNSKLNKNWKKSINPTRSFAYAANPEKMKNKRIMISLVECDTTEWDSKGTRRVINIIAKTLKAVDMNKLILKYVHPKALLMTDSGTEFSSVGLACPNTHFQVNHSLGYTNEGVNNNQAETSVSRIRRAEIGCYNGMRPQYFAFYAAEFAWRSNVSKMSLKEKFEDALKRILMCDISRAFCGYNQGRRLKEEYVIN